MSSKSFRSGGDESDGKVVSLTDLRLDALRKASANEIHAILAQLDLALSASQMEEEHFAELNAIIQAIRDDMNLVFCTPGKP